VTKNVPLGCSLLLPVGTVNSVRTRKDSDSEDEEEVAPKPKVSTEQKGREARVRFSFLGRNLHSKMPLDPTPARLKPACT
jgi:hypothetical protein